jgi:hypothetical protein
LHYYTGNWPSPPQTGKKDPPHDSVAGRQAAAGEHKAGTAPEKAPVRTTRTLFGIDGAIERREAYRMVDEAEAGSSFFRIKISPDPKTEDTKQDLHLRDVTEQTMQMVAERVHKHVQWVAAEHDDHTPKRHVHVLAVVKGRLTPQDMQAVIQRATDACLAQRQELDHRVAQQAQERGEAWERSH